MPRNLAATQAVEQQVGVAQQVILVPQRVYVPFVQATNFNAVRVGGVQGQVAGAFGVVGAATTGPLGVQALGTGAEAARAAGSEAVRLQGLGSGVSQAEVQTLNELLRRYERRVSELEDLVRQLQSAPPSKPCPN